MPVAVEFGSLVLKLKLESDRCQERLEVVEEVLFANSGIEVEKVEHLPFHEVDLGKTKAEAIVALD